MKIKFHHHHHHQLSAEEFVRRLARDSSENQVRQLRSALFLEAIDKGVADNGDLLVMQKKVGGGKTVKEKHAEDIWTLVGAIRRCECIPHTLRNGKRAKDEWRKSQAKVREGRGMLNDVGRLELCASLANKETKNCEAVGLEGGTKARVIDEGGGS